MKRRLLLTRTKATIAVLLLFAANASAQTLVFSDDFTTSAGSNFTTASGPVGTSTVWNFARSGTDYGARINGGNLTLTNDASAAANNYGWAVATTNASGFAAPYNTTLAANPGALTWTFNMRQARSNPGGFASLTYGSAFILAGTAGTTNVAGTGYAVVLGNSGSTDPLRLVRYNSGLRTHTNLITSATTGLTDFGNQYLSVKVVYTPSTNTWQLFVRNDGTAAFQDPAVGSLTLQGSVVNNTYTSATLPMMGAYWQGGLTNGQNAIFDNIKVAVALPILTSISPASRIAGTAAFPLTVFGANFVSGTSVVRWNGVNRPTTFVSPTQLTAAISEADIATSGTASVTVANGSGISTALPFTIDPAGVPTIGLSSTSLPAFTTVTGTPSAAATYTVSGANLTADVGLTAPVNFELSTNNSTYGPTLTLPRSGNVLTGQPVTIYVRLRASAPPGVYSGNIDHTTTGGVTKQVSVSGTVQAAQPTTQAAAVSFANVTSGSLTINWTNGNGARRLVLMRAGGAVNAAPVDGSTYTALPAFGGGSEIGTGNFTVYSGVGNSVTVTGLAAATVYHVAVYEFNGLAATENYLTTTPATGNRTTLNAPVGWQIYTANTVNTINFDNTVDGVNLDEFQADGLLPTAASGALNSNAWSLSGFSDGNVAFGATAPEDSDFDMGVAEGGVTESGLYAFDTPAGNRALGIQPGTGDFAPGAVTLRFQNQTGAAITSLNIGYKVYVYNDEAASSSFNFSHSADNNTFTTVPGLNLTSAAAADVIPEWKAYYRVATITGLNIPSNSYYYLRWSGATVSGSVDFDEFALDDIVAIANPTTVFAPFGGIAEGFVLNGNATLSAETTIAGNLTFNAGKLNINNQTLNLNGTVTNTVTGGLRGGGNSNLVIGGTVSPTLSFDQTTAGTTNVLNNLAIATTNANTVTIANPLVINGALSTQIGQTVDFGTNALSGALTGVLNNGTIRTQNTTASPLPSGKTWNGTGILHYNSATTAQTMVVGTYTNVTASATGGTVAAGNLTVNGKLHLPSNNPSATVGSLNMNGFTLTMGNDATNTGVGDVTGIITRDVINPNTLYTFGHPFTSILLPPVGTLPTSMSLKVTIGTAPSWRPGAINRQYDFIHTGGLNTKVVIKAHYKDSELNGNNEARLVDWARIVASNTVLEQGRSNYSTTDNFVELTNVNLSQYFTNTFNAVLLTLDESEAGSLTWNGSVNSSWTTAANWTPNATPSDNTIVYIPNAATTPNDPILNPSVLLGSLNIEPGGILISPDDAQFTINNGPGAWINNGTFVPGGGTSRVVFSNLDATIAGATDFNNVTINAGAGLRPITNNIMRIAGALINNGNLLTGAIHNTVEYTGTNQTIASPNGSVPGYDNLIINGTGALFPATLGITGNLTINQPVSLAGKSINLLGSDPQAIGGTAAIVFDNLTLNKPQEKVTLTRSVEVAGTLTLNSGNLVIGSNNLTLGVNPVAGTFSATSMIVADGSGEVRRPFTGLGSYTFPIGDLTGQADYSPVSVAVTSGDFAGAYLAVNVTDGLHPNNGSTDQNLTRYWKVRPSGITGAVATVIGSYPANDVTGSEANIAAAQLNGNFNQQTNPWVRYAGLSGNVLTATAAPLTNNQVSNFTGIKAGALTTTISGFGSFCANDAVTLTAQSVGGDAPYSYVWSPGIGNAQSFTPPTAAIGTVNYSVEVRDANGILATDTASVTVVAPSAGGTVTPSQSVCYGYVPTDLQVAGHTGDVLHWQRSSDLAFTAPVNIANASDILEGSQIGILTATTYFRAVVKNGTCAESYSTPGVIEVRSSTWDGSAWSNGVPDSATTVFITGNYTATSDLVACTMTVLNDAVVNIPSGYDVTLTGKLDAAGGSFTLENNANLIQTDDVENTGNIVVKRNSSLLKRLDYTIWSSPVTGQNLLAFSPLTLPNRFYNYNTSTNQYNMVPSPAAAVFEAAKGYLIRMPDNHPSETPAIWTGTFTGVPHNGTLAMPLANIGEGQRFNLIGNPYPSPIDAVTFADDNKDYITGTLYFWRKTNNQASPSYCSWTPLGGFVDNGEAETYDPNGIIRTGQGFFVEAKPGATQVEFNNGQRSGNNDNQFFRMAQLERNRIWLNVTGSTGGFSQTLVGYIEGATLGHDFGIDGKYFNDSPVSLYSLVGGTRYVIQGRPVPFNDADVVPLGFAANQAGSYTIAIDHVDGLFAGDQPVLIKDNLTGAVHDLKLGAYAFGSEAGTFHTRFEILYANPLGTQTPQSDANQVVIFKDRDGFTVHSGTIQMAEIEVLDLRGRLITTLTDVNSSSVHVPVAAANQVLVFRITTEDQSVVVKKVIH